MFQTQIEGIVCSTQGDTSHKGEGIPEILSCLEFAREPLLGTTVRGKRYSSVTSPMISIFDLPLRAANHL
jgi:hypothetical protein